MANLTPLSTATTTATALSNLVIVSPNLTTGYQPTYPSDINGDQSVVPTPPSFVFDYEGEQTATCTSDITDHFIENNTAIQDQISIRPVEVTTQGYVGELNNVVPGLLAPLASIANNFSTVQAYIPSLTETALIAYNEAFQLYQVATNAANAAISAWSSLNPIGGGTNVINGNLLITAPGSSLTQNKQQTAFQYFYGYWVNRTLFTIQTPWAIFENMAIKILRPIQSAETRVITTFEVTFKQILTVQYALQPTLSAGRAATQSADPLNQGTSTPPSSMSLGSAVSSSY